MTSSLLAILLSLTIYPPASGNAVFAPGPQTVAALLTKQRFSDGHEQTPASAIAHTPEAGGLPNPHGRKLKPWQAEAYRLLAEGKGKRVHVFYTEFGEFEGIMRGSETHSGSGCSEKVAAANRLPEGSFIWVRFPKGWEVREVLDTGAHWNDDVADRNGASLWVDYWRVRETPYDATVREAIIIGR